MGGLAARLGPKNQHLLPAGVRDGEFVAMQIEITNQGVTHVRDIRRITDVRTRPQFPKPLTRGGQFVDQGSSRGSSGSLPAASRSALTTTSVASCQSTWKSARCGV